MSLNKKLRTNVNHILKIDVLRGISIILVLYHHFNIPYKLQLGMLPNGEYLTHLLARNGNYGVTMFFVISGFLITQSILNRDSNLKDLHIKNFYIRRVARILPCLVLLIAMVTLLGIIGLQPFVNHQPNGVEVSYVTTVLAALTFSMNVLIIKYGWVNYALGVLWSLSVEEVFYLVFPILAKYLKTLFLSTLMLGIILIAPYIRHLYYLDPNEAYLYAYFASFDAIAIGVLTALCCKKIKIPQSVNVIAIALMLVLYFVAPIKEISTWSISIFAFCTAILILRQTNIVSDHSVLVWFGKRSYELYLFHLIILGLIKSFFIPSETIFVMKLLLLGIYIIGTLALSYLIERYYSSTLNQHIRKHFLS